MIFAASVGIAAGALIAAALAGFRHVRNWARAAWTIRLGGILLSIAALVAAYVEIRAGGPPPSAALALVIIATGGILSQSKPETSPAMLLASGLVLACATVVQRSNTPTSMTVAFALVSVANLQTLPAMGTAAREWRRMPVRDMAAWLWCGVTIALAASVITHLIERGAWLGSDAIAAWMLVAWIASSGGLLMRRGRPRAALIFTAALAIAFAALGG